MVARKKHYRPAGKKKEGNAARFCTRSQAVKQLQINLPLFRKLCILKGIFPREPKKKMKGNHHTYYHLKDILFIQHDPLVQQMRDIRAYGKKVKKATAKKNKDRAVVLQKRRPTYKLDHVILQRYPTFIDALRDLDDCLTMVHLFACLPAIEDRIEVKRIQNCRRMSHEWQAFISRTHKLRKVFVSVKGIYYQAEVKGQMITWLTPHPLQQVLTEDIDFNIMLNFLEFYEALLAFVNCHLYRSINVKYPPILDPRLEAFAAELYALSRYFDASSRSSELDPQVSTLPGTGKVAESELRLAQLQYQLPSNEAGALASLVENVSGEEEEDNDTLVCKGLFKDMKIFLNREVNRESLLFVIPAFGGMVSWKGDGAPFEEEDNSITHQIVDRPLQHELFEGRKYVQPQWVYDCVNAKKILPTQDYLAGRVLPPHLSPFVDPKEEGYVPDYALKIEQWKTAQILPLPDVGKEDLVDPQDIADIEKAKEAAKNEKKLKALQEKYFEGLKEEVKGVPGSTSISEADNLSAKLNESTEEPGPKKIKGDDDRDLKLKSKKKKGQNEAMKGVPASTSISEPDPDFELIKPDEDERHLKLMSKRKRGLYEAMKINKERKKDSVELILKRKRNLEESQKTKK